MPLLNFKTPMINLSGRVEGVFLINIGLEQKSLSAVTELINKLGILMPANLRFLPLPNCKYITITN